jgi:hypothetical protein
MLIVLCGDVRFAAGSVREAQGRDAPACRKIRRRLTSHCYVYCLHAVVTGAQRRCKLLQLDISFEPILLS